MVDRLRQLSVTGILKRMKKHSFSGFTIVELLIVIVVIGILAAIVIVAYNGVQQRAQAAAVISGIKQVDKAFRLAATDEAAPSWWKDTYFTGAGNPLIADVITSPKTSIKKYLPQAPSVNGVTTGWYYDNDGDSRDPADCDLTWNGAIIGIPLASSQVAQAVDNQLDDGNLRCGKVRYTGNNIIYQLGFTQEL